MNPDDRVMRQKDIVLPSKQCLGGLCIIYGLLILYSSTVIGPAGLNFVYLDPAEALQRFMATRFVPHGSDQRADWIGNLLMLVPYGFMVAGALWPTKSDFKLPAALGAFLICFATIVAIKYLQLFFPPRTVTLNYITAQTIGAAAGCGCFVIIQQRFGRSVHDENQAIGLILALRLYFIALSVYILMPLDFALDAVDLRLQVRRFPATILAWPGADRPMAQQTIVILAATAAFIPVGMLLTFVKRGDYQVRRSILAVAGLGLSVTTGLYILSVLVISAFPVMASILYRTCGVMAGAAAINWLAEQDADALKRRLRHLVPWAIGPYVACLLGANRLWSIHWLSVQEAVAHVYPLGLLPLFDYYIVTKAAAAKNIIGHVVLYMPVGVLLWLRYGEHNGTKAFIVAATLSFAAEFARYFRPGLEGDINAVLVAGLAAMLAARLMPMIWSMVEAIGSRSATTPKGQWNRHSRHAGREISADPIV